MTDTQRGKYIILLCLQHQQGMLTEEDMLNICKTYDEKIYRKFIKTEDGLYYNERMKREVDRRKEYSDSRRKNRTHMSNICKSYVKHMETETETININKDNTKKETFKKPTVDEISEYCKERNNDVNPNKFFDFYEAKGWLIGKNKVKDWKACVRTWEKNSNEVKEPWEK